MDLTDTIIPKSDQLNAEDLLTGPRTFTVAEVKKGTAEQPVDIHLVEFPGRPFKPSKTVRRILVSAWGAEANTYAGRRMTLYRDPAVKFGGMDVGGIRVSHLSHIDKPLTVVLAVSKGKRAPYVIKPLADAPTPAQAAANDPLKALGVALREAKLTDREEALAYISQVVGRTVLATKDLTTDEITKVVGALAEDTAEPTPPGAES
jgi:hypothetical protein